MINILLVLLLTAPAAAYSLKRKLGADAPPEEYVNVLGGTNNLGSQDVSYGNVLPEVALPWGFNGWAPQTSPPAGGEGSGGWWFLSGAHTLYGVRCTKQPSPWIGDYGQFRIMAHLVDPAHASATTPTPYDPNAADWSPYHFQATLMAYGTTTGTTTIEVTPTMHGALVRVNFPPYDPEDAGFNQTRRLVFALDQPASDALALDGVDPVSGLPRVRGVSTSNSGGVAEGFGHYFYATVAGGSRGAGAAPVLLSTATGVDGGVLWCFLDLDPSAQPAANGDGVVVRVATSLISAAQAEANHRAEVAGVDFDAAVAAAKAAWHAELRRVVVADAGRSDAAAAHAYRTVLYSSMYRASKYPRDLSEADATTGERVHWSPYTGQVERGRLSADSGFWDAYRTTYSYLGLVRPRVVAEMMDGWLNAWREGGWVPQWSSPGYRGSMTGTMSDVSMAEAIVKLPHCGTARAAAAGYCVNATALLAASLQNAMVAPGPDAQGEGRACLGEYLALGYVPHDGSCDASVSRTLNYLHADWALAQACTFLGEPLCSVATAALLAARAANFTQLLDPATGFLAPRLQSGKWAPGFDPFAWGDAAGYTEGGPWQYRLEVPYDPLGLQTALAAISVDASAVLQQANAAANNAFHAGSYSSPIHEQMEMVTNCWGQWALNNQPAWAMQAMGVGMATSLTAPQASRAQAALRRSLNLFKPGASMFPGDEDNGSMGAWFVLNALGLYPLSPASGDYLLGAPLFANVTLTLSDDEASGSSSGPVKLTVLALNQGPANVYVQAASFNGALIEGRVSVSYAELMQGGELRFEMGPAAAA